MMSAGDSGKMHYYLVILCAVLLFIPAGAAGGAAPAVTGILPVSGFNTTTESITNLAGSNFASGATVMLTPVNASPVHSGSIVNGDGGATLYYPLSVFVSGNYAYVASSMSNSLEIVDISNPAVPVHKNKTVLGPATYKPDDLFVSGNYAYITISGGPGANALEIVDVSDPQTPFKIGRIQYLDGGALLNNPQSVCVSGTYAYVASAGNNALEIVDVSNPAAPVHKGSIVHGAGGAMLNGARSVVVSGNYAYIASAGSDALEIVDVSNPAAPVHKSSIVHGAGGALLINPTGVYIAGDYAYVASYDSDALEIIDISDSSTPVHTGSIVHTTNGALLYGPTSVHVSGNYAYVAGSRSNALEIVDITNPAAPVHKGSIENGAGGALLYLPMDVCVSGSYAYVVGYSNALEIVDISTITATAVSVGSPNQITCTFDLTGKPAGLNTVVVTNPDGKFGTLTGGFEIIHPVTPVASFSGTPLAGRAPLAVIFKGNSTRIPASWYWSFGDGGYSTVQNPTHTYLQGGPYTVSLTVTTPEGSGLLARTDYVIVNGDMIGVFRNTTGTWHLDYDNNGVADISFRFGKTGDMPVTADWNADGTSDVGVLRPATGYWYLDTTRTGVVDTTFQFGKIGDIPVTGDWNADGSSDAGVFRPATGYWYLNYYKDDRTNNVLHFGTSGDSPKAGTWITGNPRVAPVAAFVADTTSGISPLTVQFTDQSTGSPASWYWSFGDKTTSTHQNPVHTYTSTKKTRSYTVILTVTNAFGSSTEKENAYITIRKK